MNHLHDARRNRRWAGLLGLPLAATIIGGAYETSEGRIEKDLNRRTESAAAAQGFDISADYSGQDAHIRCLTPGTDVEALKSMLITMKGPQNPDGKKEPYIDVASCAALPEPEPAPEPVVTDPPPVVTDPPPVVTDPPPVVTDPPPVVTDAAAADLEAAAVLENGSSKITLRGTVQTEAQRKALFDAAVASFGAGDVIDELVVAPNGASTADTDDLVGRMGTIAAYVNGRMSEAEAGIKNGALYVRGTYVSDKAKSEIDAKAAEVGIEPAAVEIEPLAAATAECAAELTSEINTLVAANPIPFTQSSADLTADAGSLLDQVSALALKCGTSKIEVQGHTDGDGGDASNQALSQRRADTVLAALITRGVAAEQLVAVGYGESQPIAPNDTPENKAKNRRVVFAVAAQ